MAYKVTISRRAEETLEDLVFDGDDKNKIYTNDRNC